MFQVDQQWKCKNSDVLQAIFSRPGMQCYRSVELSLNVQLFHVDALVIVDDECYYARFILDNFEDVVDLLSRGDFSKVKISLQSKREDCEDYLMRTVAEVFESVSNPGVYFYKCQDGTLQKDSIYGDLLDIGEATLIWASG